MIWGSVSLSLTSQINAIRVGKVVTIMCSWNTNCKTAGSYNIGTLPINMRPQHYVVAPIFRENGAYNGRAIVNAETGQVTVLVTQNNDGIEFTLTYLSI